MAEQTVAPQFSTTNSAMYRTAYMQSKMERLEHQWNRAETELFQQYDADIVRQTFIREEVERLDEYVKKQREAIASGASGAVAGDGGAAPGLLDLVKELRATSTAISERASEDMDRVVELNKQYDDSWTADSSVVTALTHFENETRNKLIGYDPDNPSDMAAMEGVIESSLGQDRVQATLENLATRNQKRDAAIKYVSALAGLVGGNVDQQRLQTLVAGKFNLAVEDLDPVAFQAEKEAMVDEFLEQGFAGGRTGLRDLEATLQKALKAQLDPSSQQSLAQIEKQAAVDKYLTSPDFALVKTALADGRLTVGEQVVGPDGQEYIIDSGMVDRYESMKRGVQLRPSSVAPHDRQWFLETTLAQRTNLAEAEGELVKRRSELSALSPKLPTAEDISRRTATRVRAETRNPAFDKLSDPQKVMFSSLVGAHQNYRDHDLDADTSASGVAAARMRDMVASGSLPRADVMAHVAEFADTASERDEILQKFFSTEINRAATQRFEPPAVTEPEPKKPRTMRDIFMSDTIEQLERTTGQGVSEAISG